MTLDAAMTPLELSQHLADFPPPTLVDVRRQPAFDSDPHVIPGALRRLPEAVDDWACALEPWRPVVVYCVRGHEVGKDAAKALRAHGFQARYLAGGLEQWRADGYPTKPHVAPTRWVTRERPKIDRIACPWLVRRFIDPTAEFFYVPKSDVQAFAAANNATAYDIPDVPYGHVGPECSFDAFIRRHELAHPALDPACSHRARRRHGNSRTRCAGRWIAGRVARALANVRQRSRDAEMGNARLRRALRVVSRNAKRRRCDRW